MFNDECSVMHLFGALALAIIFMMAVQNYPIVLLGNKKYAESFTNKKKKIKPQKKVKFAVPPKMKATRVTVKQTPDNEARSITSNIPKATPISQLSQGQQPKAQNMPMSPPQYNPDVPPEPNPEQFTNPQSQGQFYEKMTLSQPQQTESMSGDTFFSEGGLSPANGSEWGSPY